MSSKNKQPKPISVVIKLKRGASLFDLEVVWHDLTTVWSRLQRYSWFHCIKNSL